MCILNGQNLLNHKKTATTQVAVASPKIPFGRVLFQAGEEATDQVCAEADIITSSNPRVKAAKHRVIEQPVCDSLDDQVGGARSGFAATTVLRFGVHPAAVFQPDS